MIVPIMVNGQCPTVSNPHSVWTFIVIWSCQFSTLCERSCNERLTLGHCVCV